MVVTFTSSNITCNNTYTILTHTMTITYVAATYSSSSIATFTLQQWWHLLAVTHGQENSELYAASLRSRFHGQIGRQLSTGWRWYILLYMTIFNWMELIHTPLHEREDLDAFDLYFRKITDLKLQHYLLIYVDHTSKCYFPYLLNFIFLNDITINSYLACGHA